MPCRDRVAAFGFGLSGCRVLAIFLFLFVMSMILGGLCGHFRPGITGLEDAPIVEDTGYVDNRPGFEEALKNNTLDAAWHENKDVFDERRASVQSWLENRADTAKSNGLLVGAITTGLAAPVLPAIYYMGKMGDVKRPKFKIGLVYFLILMLVGTFVTWAFLFGYRSSVDMTTILICFFGGFVPVGLGCFGLWVASTGSWTPWKTSNNGDGNYMDIGASQQRLAEKNMEEQDTAHAAQIRELVGHLPGAIQENEWGQYVYLNSVDERDPELAKKVRKLIPVDDIGNNEQGQQSYYLRINENDNNYRRRLVVLEGLL